MIIVMRVSLKQFLVLQTKSYLPIPMTEQHWPGYYGELISPPLGTPVVPPVYCKKAILFPFEHQLYLRIAKHFFIASLKKIAPSICHDGTIFFI